MSNAFVVAEYGLREALRRRAFLVVLLLTAVFLVLYWLGVRTVSRHLAEVEPPQGIDANAFVGSTMLGLAMFATLFLGTVLAVFLTLGVVRGDAERGLLQPLVVRPVGRATLLSARWLGAAVVCAAYELVVFAVAVAITGSVGGWYPDRIVVPGVELAGAVALIAALSLLGSVFLTSTANGIAIFMVFGAGLVSGLLGQIGEGIQSERLKHIGRVMSWVLPFEALYQDGLRRLTIDTVGLTKFLIQLGPFGGAQQGGTALELWAALYLVLVGGVAVLAFERRDL